MYSPWENKLPHTYVNQWRGAPSVKTWLPTVVVGGDTDRIKKHANGHRNLRPRNTGDATRLLCPAANPP